MSAVPPPAAPPSPAARLDVSAWAETDGWPRGATVHRLFEARAALRPEAPAVRHRAEVITYAELNARANRLARHLRALGVRGEARVAVCLERGVERIAAVLAVLKAGGAYLPVDPADPAGRAAWMLEDAGAAVVVADAARAAALPPHPAPVVRVDADAGEIARHPSGDLEGEADPLALAYVTYTSGSSGRPKGIAVPHRAVVRLARGADFAQLAPGDRVAQLSNASFDAATWETWGALLNGAAAVVIDRGDALSAAALAAALRTEGITALFLTTALFNEVARQAPGAFATLRHLLFGGEAADAAAVRRVLEAGPPERLLHVYGPTENTTFSTWHRVAAVAPDAASVPIGLPIARSTAHVVDGEMREAREGELLVGGDGLARGYAGQPALTAERFVPDPFSPRPGARLYRTGDRVRWCESARVRECESGSAPHETTFAPSHSRTFALEFVGRLDRQVKLRGFRIEPGEVEAALRANPAVADAAVAVREDRPGDRRLVGYVVAHPGAAARAADLRAHLRGRLPEYMVPAALVPLSRLPLTSAGKVDRGALPPPAPAREAGWRYVAPRDQAERAVAAAWAAVLDVDEVGAEDGFVALGGHSLAAMRVVSRLKAELGVAPPLAALLADGTVASVAAALRERAAAADDEPPLVAVPRGGDLPLSSSQERVWLLTRMAPASLAYHTQWTLRVRGALDAAALEGALNDVVARHEIFRTTFHAGPAGPVQRIHPPPSVRLPVVDVSGDAEAERALGRWMETEFARRFDLETFPLARWTLVRLGAGEHVFVMVEHHLVHDGWSLNVFLRDLLACYRARLAGTPPDLPALPLQFADYCAWQRAWMRSAAARAQLGFWREKLAGGPPALELPLDRPRPAVQRFRGAAPRFAVPGEVMERLGRVARDEGATPFMAMMAAFAALLARLTGERELCVGTGVAVRRRREVEEVIGMFVNNLVLRLDLGGDPSFRALLRHARATLVEAYAHQDAPFDAVVEAVRPARETGRNPLFQAMFSFHDSPRPELDLPGATAQLALALPNGSAKFDLSVVAIPRLPDGGMELVWEYDADLFDAATMERAAARYLALLAAVAEDPALRLSRIPLLEAGERRTVLGAWNDTARPYPRDATLPALFAEWVERTPDAEAVAHGAERLTYRQLDARATRLARHLRALGVRGEAPVAVLLDRSADFVVACLAALKAGGAYLPIDTAFPTQRVEWMVADAGARVIVTTRFLAQGLPADDAAVVRLDADADVIAARLPAPLPAEAHPEGAACLLYTSGSTGWPRGIVVTHRGVARLVRGGGELHPAAGDRVAHASNVSFDVTTWDVWGPLLNGGAVVVVDRETVLAPDALARVLRDERVTSVFLTTALFGQVARQAPGTFGGVRDVLFGGEAADADAVRRVLASPTPPRRLANAYGPAENTTYTTYTTVHAVADVPPGAATVPIGRPVPNTRAYVLDGALEPVPPGCAGELYAAGDGVARGYAGHPALTAERFVPDPFAGGPGARMYRTGDRARWTPRGELEFLGRVDRQVKLRGFRIEPGEVEAVLRAHPAVADAAVAAREDRPGDRRLVGYVVPAPGAGFDAAALRSHVKQRLPGFMVPAALVPLGHIPLNAVGKVDHRALPAPEAAPAVLAEPRTALERRVAALWAEVLGVERVGVDESFFDLGGHSMLLMRLHARLAEVAPGVTVLDLFTHPTVASLCALVRGHDAPAPAEVARDQGGGARLDAGRERLRARRLTAEGS